MPVQKRLETYWRHLVISDPISNCNSIILLLILTKTNFLYRRVSFEIFSICFFVVFFFFQNLSYSILSLLKLVSFNKSPFQNWVVSIKVHFKIELFQNLSNSKLQYLSIFLRWWGIIYIIYIFWTIVLIFVAMFITTFRLLYVWAIKLKDQINWDFYHGKDVTGNKRRLNKTRVLTKIK